MTNPSRGRGRPQVYKLVTVALDPSWPYTPSALASFANMHGFLELLEDDVTEYLANKRARVSFGRQRELKEFPKSGDALLCINGRHFPAWLGYRWDGKAGLQSSINEYEEYFAPLFEELNCHHSYDLLRLIEVWNSLPVPTQPLKLPSHYGYKWNKAIKICRHIFLVRRALQRGLNLNQEYSYLDWKEIKTPEKRDLIMFAHVPFLFTHQGVVSISRFISKSQNLGIIGNEDKQARSYRYSLREFCRLSGFPEHGDMLILNGVAKEPAWYVKRWRRAFTGIEIR